MSEPVRNEERQLFAGILNGCLFVSVALLVAIVIILRHTEKPRPTRLICMMNLKTLSTYLAAYADDHRGDYPPAER